MSLIFGPQGELHVHFVMRHDLASPLRIGREYSMKPDLMLPGRRYEPCESSQKSDWLQQNG